MKALASTARGGGDEPYFGAVFQYGRRPIHTAHKAPPHPGGCNVFDRSEGGTLGPAQLPNQRVDSKAFAPFEGLAADRYHIIALAALTRSDAFNP